MPLRFEEDGHTIYGVGKLAKLYEEFTRQTAFNTARKYCLKPSMGGSFFGDIKRETKLDKKSFRVITSLVCNSDAEIKGTLPLGKLHYFKASNQEYYKTRAPQYFNLIKRHIIRLDKKNTSHKCLWCFFPMYHTEHDHLAIEELSAYILWFERPLEPTAKILEFN